jgi:hypothetical protein
MAMDLMMLRLVACHTNQVSTVFLLSFCLSFSLALGYTTQLTYIIYGKTGRLPSSLIQNLQLSSLSSSDGYKIIGGGFIVSPAGDVDGDGLSDVMITSAPTWFDNKNIGGLVITYPLPGSRLTRSPTRTPSSRPSHQQLSPSGIPSVSPSGSSGDEDEAAATTALPSSLPSSSSPSLLSPLSLVGHPTYSPDSSVAPSVLVVTLSPTKKPTRKPSVAPSIKPSLSPSVHPSVLPSLIPTLAPTKVPTLTPSTRQPSLKPSRFPSLSPSFNLNPSFSPSFVPTYPPDVPFVDKSINKGGFYNATSVIQHFIIDSSASVALLGSNGRNKYTILHHSNMTITILNFHLSSDVIDLSRYSPSISALQYLSYKTYPLTFLLEDQQNVIFSSYDEFELSEENFIFSTSSSETTVTTAGLVDFSMFTPNVIATISVFGGLLLGFCTIFQFLKWRIQKGKERKKKLEKERISNKREKEDEKQSDSSNEDSDENSDNNESGGEEEERNVGHNVVAATESRANEIAKWNSSFLIQAGNGKRKKKKNLLKASQQQNVPFLSDLEQIIERSEAPTFEEEEDDDDDDEEEGVDYDVDDYNEDEEIGSSWISSSHDNKHGETYLNNDNEVDAQFPILATFSSFLFSDIGTLSDPDSDSIASLSAPPAPPNSEKIIRRRKGKGDIHMLLSAIGKTFSVSDLDDESEESVSFKELSVDGQREEDALQEKIGEEEEASEEKNSDSIGFFDYDDEGEDEKGEDDDDDDGEDSSSPRLRTFSSLTEQERRFLSVYSQAVRNDDWRRKDLDNDIESQIE